MKRKNCLIGGGILFAMGALAIGAAIALKRRRTIPIGVEAVSSFDINRFTGKWYEIARMNNRFEKNLNNVTAEYSMGKNGKIKVVNRGYNYKKNKIEEATGKVEFAGSPYEGKLKVSFDGLFYSGYNIIEIDKDYKYALVAGGDMRCLWLLSREPSMPQEMIEYYLEVAESYDYKTSKLTWVGHDEDLA